jgi:glutamyl-tRNA synthetase
MPYNGWYFETEYSNTFDTTISGYWEIKSMSMSTSKKSNGVVCRFCPSNTGWLHLGSARTALYSYAYAKKMGGKVILRIEDTDKARSTHESLVDIMTGLDWLGLKFDDGPSLEDVKNKNYKKDYFQSQRTDIYNKYVDKLLQDGMAYEQDGAVMFKMNKIDYQVNDLILGRVNFDREECKDFAIRRADGGVLFHLCVVIDDALSGVTHVIRANDHLSNTPKHIALYNALKFKVPQYAHMPLILDDKGAKLSKRRDDQFVLIKDYRANGYLPETIINILGTLGWSAPNGVDKFDLDFLCQNFDIKQCGKANARYDQKKLLSFNSRDLAAMNFDKFCEKAYEYGQIFYSDFINKCGTKQRFNEIMLGYHGRVKTLKDIFTNANAFVDNNIEYDSGAVEKIVTTVEGAIGILDDIRNTLDNLMIWNKDTLNKVVTQFSVDKKLSMNKVAQPIRVALFGNTVSPPIDTTLLILGKKESIRRIDAFLEKFALVKA